MVRSSSSAPSSTRRPGLPAWVYKLRRKIWEFLEDLFEVRKYGCVALCAAGCVRAFPRTRPPQALHPIPTWKPPCMGIPHSPHCTRARLWRYRAAVPLTPMGVNLASYHQTLKLTHARASPCANPAYP